MDISQLKDTIVSFFKTHSSLLVPVVIGLIGGLLFIPTLLMSSKLKEQVANESISKRGRRIAFLSRTAVAREQWKEEQKYQDKHREDANEIELLARRSTQRELLSYKIFPAPKDRSQFLFEEFGQQFRGAIDKLMARVNAGERPMQADLEKSLQGSLGSRSPSDWDDDMGVPYGRLDGARTEIIDALCRAKAESASIYANPVNLSGYVFWEKYDYAGMDEAVKDCWYYQLAYWIIEDVIDTIDTMNSDSDSVLTSPVKRLLWVWFTPTDEFARRTVGSVSAVGYYTSGGVVTRAKPHYVLSIRDGFTRGDLCTGRVCNDDIDVMHFKVRVVVSAKSILPFMRQLCSAKQHKFKGFFGEGQEQIFKHNQITILESKIGLVARGGGEYEGGIHGSYEYEGGRGSYDYEGIQIHNLYRYGEDAVVELELICEYVFNKKGYDKIKPELVEKGESLTTGSR